MQFQKLTAAQYAAFEQHHPAGSYMQTTYQQQVLSQRGWTSELMGVVDEHGEVIATELLNSRPLHVGTLFEVSGGPLLDWQNADLVKFLADETIAYAKARRGLVLRWLPNMHTRAFDDDGKVTREFDDAGIRHLQAAGFNYQPSKPVVDGEYSKISLGYEFVKDLSELTETTLFASYTKDAQYAIKKTHQFGVKLRRLAYEDLPEFKKYADATAERRGFTDKSLDYYQKTFKAYGDQVQFIFAELNFADYLQEEAHKREELSQQIATIQRKLAQSPTNKHFKKQLNELNDQDKQHVKRITDASQQREKYGDTAVLAGAMFFTQPQEVSYMFSFTNDEFKRYYAPYLIQDEMLHQAVVAKIPLYNFYGVTGNFDGSDGVLKFKQSFNGETLETAGVFTRPVRPFAYKVVQDLKHLTGRQ